MKKGIVIVLCLIIAIAAGCQSKEISSIPQAPSQNISEAQTDLTVPEPDSELMAEDTDTAAPSTDTRERILRNAEALTEHLVDRVLRKGNDAHGEEITELELFSFFVTLPVYTENTDHPYHTSVTKTPEGLYVFPEGNVKQIAYQLFGVENWSFDDSTLSYNAEEGQYESSLAFGTGWTYYACSDLHAVYLEDLGVVEVTFELEEEVDIGGDPGWVDAGKHMIRYLLLDEGYEFLRFESVQYVS